MNPFNLSGPEFLGLYAVVFGVGLFLAILLRRALRVPADPPDEIPRLDPFEVAHLAGGSVLAVNAAVAQLLQSGALKLDETSGKLDRAGSLPDRSHPLVSAVYGAEVKDVKSVRKAAEQEVARIGEGLEEKGLLVSGGAGRWLPVLLMLLVAGFAAVKIKVGIDRQKPVTVLIIAAVVTAGIALFGFGRKVHRSRRGDRVLDALQKRHAALQATAKKQPGSLALNDLSLAVGLFGLGIIATGPLAGLHRLLTPPSGSSSCGGGDSGGGGDGGGGGGGCGGCGGGGGD